ncbi:MAG: hypothetical protein JW881_07925 [Spirochaetales bacterium]|nr:hypothetical protein [Spirochaetales bacterium]
MKTDSKNPRFFSHRIRPRRKITRVCLMFLLLLVLVPYLSAEQKKIAFNGSTLSIVTDPLKAPDNVTVGGYVWFDKVLKKTVDSSGRIVLYGNIGLRVSLNAGTVKIYGKYPGAAYKKITEASALLQNPANPVQVFNSGGAISHMEWASPLSEPDFEPQTTETGGTVFTLKVVYTDVPGSPIYTWYDIIVEDTIPGLIAGGIIGDEGNERQLDNCYQIDDDGELKKYPADSELEQWYLWKSWLEYVGFNCDESLLASYIPDETWYADIMTEDDPLTSSPCDYSAFVFFGSSETGTKKTAITKPILFSEGIDFENNLSWRFYLYKLLGRYGLWRTCLEQGYDIIFLNYTDSLKSLQFSAECVIDVIEKINAEKVPDSRGIHKNIVIGGSMGGLVCRYALKVMESEAYIDEQQTVGTGGIVGHDTELFVSFDAPQQGANLPLCLQLAIEEINNCIPHEDLADFRATMHAYAPKSMLINHVKGLIDDNYKAEYPSYPHAYRDWFLNDLEALRTEEDGSSVYPRDCRSVAMANGSGYGRSQHIDGLTMGEHTLLFGTVIGDLVYLGYSLGESLPLIVTDAANVPEILFPPLLITDLFLHKTVHYDKTHLDDLIPIDSCPGSTTPFIKMFADAINDVDGCAGIFAYAAYTFPGVTYMPTVSALDIRHMDGTPWNVNGNLSEIPNILNKTAFYDIRWEPDNNDHASISPQCANFLLKYVSLTELDTLGGHIGDGDVYPPDNPDGILTAFDIEAIRDYIDEAPGSDFTAMQLLRADANNDGYLSVHDIAILENSIACDMNGNKAGKYIVGDLDNNMIINEDDLAALQTLLETPGAVSYPPLTVEQVLADVNGDGFTNEDDTVCLENFLLESQLNTGIELLSEIENCRRIWFIPPLLPSVGELD